MKPIMTLGRSGRPGTSIGRSPQLPVAAPCPLCPLRKCYPMEHMRWARNSSGEEASGHVTKRWSRPAGTRQRRRCGASWRSLRAGMRHGVRGLSPTGGCERNRLLIDFWAGA